MWRCCLKKSSEWLRALVCVSGCSGSAVVLRVRSRTVDATTVKEPGPSWSPWKRRDLREDFLPRCCGVSDQVDTGSMQVERRAVMKHGERVFSVCAVAAGVGLVVGCGGDMSSPVAPSPPLTSNLSASQSTAAASVFVQASSEDIDLKASAPTPVEPVGDVEITDFTPLLVASHANGEFVDEDFEYEFSIHTTTSGSLVSVEKGKGTPYGTGSTSYQVRNRLGLGTNYRWRIRALLEGAFGPWSDYVSFRTAVYRLGAPQPTAPRGVEVGTRPVFVVRNGEVEGDVGSRVIRIEVALDGGFTDAIVGEAKMQGGRGRETRIRLGEALQPKMSYFWRARAVASNTSYGPVVSPWSVTARFTTRAGTSLGPVMSPPPNLLHVIQRVAAEHPDAVRAAHSAGSGGDLTGADDPGFKFLFLTVEALRKENGGRWGITFWTNPGSRARHSKDRLGYYLGNGDPNGSTNMAVIEFFVWRDGSLAWFDATRSLKRDYPRARGEWRDLPK